MITDSEHVAGHDSRLAGPCSGLLHWYSEDYGESLARSGRKSPPPGTGGQRGLVFNRGGPIPFSTAVADRGYNVAAMSASKKPLVGIIMGSKSDWETLQHAAAQLDELGVPYEAQVVSAHRTPDLLFEYAGAAAGRGLEVIIAGAGGAAHLPGMAASKTALPVLGVPVESKALKGLDSLLSIAQMPGGVPVGTMAIGKAGAINAALLATAILGNKHDKFRKAYERFRKMQTQRVLEDRKLDKVAK